MNLKPRRNWYRFSLRTMFVAVTLLCAWLGYSVNWIRQRQEFRHRHAVIFLEGPTEPAAPGLLWIFGEYGFGFGMCHVNGFEEAQRLFPECVWIGSGPIEIWSAAESGQR